MNKQLALEFIGIILHHWASWLGVEQGDNSPPQLFGCQIITATNFLVKNLVQKCKILILKKFRGGDWNFEHPVGKLQLPASPTFSNPQCGCIPGAAARANIVRQRWEIWVFKHNLQQLIYLQKHFSIFISLQEFILSSNNSTMEQSTQGQCWSAISELLPESFAAIAHLCVSHIGAISHREFTNYVPETENWKKIISVGMTRQVITDMLL